jgi:hypothetical protein
MRCEIYELHYSRRKHTALCGPMHNMMHLLFINFTYIQKNLKYIELQEHEHW